MGVFDMFAVLYGRRLFSSVFAITMRRDTGLYEVPLSLLCFGMGIMFDNFHMCGNMLALRVFTMLVRIASPRGPMCFRFKLSGLCFITSWI